LHQWTEWRHSIETSISHLTCTRCSFQGCQTSPAAQQISSRGGSAREKAHVQGTAIRFILMLSTQF
jgi:hypothetical protein